MARWTWTDIIQIGPAGQLLTTGSGDPNGTVIAPVGSLYLRIDGSTNQSIYVKEAGTDNTGWVAIIGLAEATVSLYHDDILNSSASVLNLISGNGMTISDLGAGQIRIAGPTFKAGGNPLSVQSTLDIRAGTGVSVLDTGAGRVEISWSNPFVVEIDGVPASSSTTLNFQSGSDISIVDGGNGIIQINSTGSGISSVIAMTSKTTGLLYPLSNAGAYSIDNTEKSYVSLDNIGMLVKVVADRAARIRLYSTAELRDADLIRSNTIPPTPGLEHGVLADLYLDGITTPLTWYLNPAALYTNGDTPISSSIYYNITNLSNNVHTVKIDFYHVTL